MRRLEDICTPQKQFLSFSFTAKFEASCGRRPPCFVAQDIMSTTAQGRDKPSSSLKGHDEDTRKKLATNDESSGDPKEESSPQNVIGDALNTTSSIGSPSLGAGDKELVPKMNVLGGMIGIGDEEPEDIKTASNFLAKGSAVAFVVWLLLVFLSYTFAPPESFEYLEGAERNANLTILALLIVTNGTMVSTIPYHILCCTMMCVELKMSWLSYLFHLHFPISNSILLTHSLSSIPPICYVRTVPSYYGSYAN